MSAEPIFCTVLGKRVEGTVVDSVTEADFGSGPQMVHVVDVDGSRYRVDESDISPR